MPNILWFCTDQQRGDTIHCLGNPHIRTPHIDALAAQGVAFTHAYCQSPVCTPSRASFLTGRYPRTTRCRQNGARLPADEVLVTRIFAEHGFDCGLIGKLHLSPCHKRVEQRGNDGYRLFLWSHHPMPDWEENAYIHWLRERGYEWEDLYHRPPEAFAWAGVPADLHQTTWCVEKAIEFITQERDGPWLLSINTFDPHHPFDPPKEYLDRYDPDSLPDPLFQEGELEGKPRFQRIDHQGGYGGTGLSFARATPRQRREVVAAYYAMIELIDDQLGRLLRALDESGQRNNTIVLFMSDHGEMLGDHGLFWKGPFFYEGMVRVPLIISCPGKFAQGLRREELVELVDLAPTLLEAVGLPVPGRMQGRSLLPLLMGQSEVADWRNSVYCEYYNAMPWHDRQAFATMYFDGRFKLNVYHGEPIGEMYDLATDPHEFDNLWDRPDRQTEKLKLLQSCFDQSVFTLDPLTEREAIW